MKTSLESLDKTADAARESAEVAKRVAEAMKGIVERFAVHQGGFKVLSGKRKLAAPTLSGSRSPVEYRQNPD